MSLALALLLPPGALATTTLEPAGAPATAFLDLAPMAERVVVARVHELRSETIDGAFVTFAELDVAETLLGEDAPTLTVHWPGGSDGVLETLVAGTPLLAPGDEVVVALDADDRPMGLARGVLLLDPANDTLRPAPALGAPPRGSSEAATPLLDLPELRTALAPAH